MLMDRVDIYILSMHYKQLELVTGYECSFHKLKICNCCNILQVCRMTLSGDI